MKSPIEFLVVLIGLSFWKSLLSMGGLVGERVFSTLSKSLQPIPFSKLDLQNDIKLFSS